MVHLVMLSSDKIYNFPLSGVTEIKSKIDKYKATAAYVVSGKENANSFADALQVLKGGSENEKK